MQWSSVSSVTLPDTVVAFSPSPTLIVSTPSVNETTVPALPSGLPGVGPTFSVGAGLPVLGLVPLCWGLLPLLVPTAQHAVLSHDGERAGRGDDRGGGGRGRAPRSAGARRQTPRGRCSRSEQSFSCHLLCNRRGGFRLPAKTCARAKAHAGDRKSNIRPPCGSQNRGLPQRCSAGLRDPGRRRLRRPSPLARPSLPGFPMQPIRRARSRRSARSHRPVRSCPPCRLRHPSRLRPAHRSLRQGCVNLRPRRSLRSRASCRRHERRTRRHPSPRARRSRHARWPIGRCRWRTELRHQNRSRRPRRLRRPRHRRPGRGCPDFGDSHDRLPRAVRTLVWGVRLMENVVRDRHGHRSRESDAQAGYRRRE